VKKHEIEVELGDRSLPSVGMVCCNDMYRKSDPYYESDYSNAGMYFDEMGQMFLYTAQWKIVSYADLKPVHLLWKQVKEHQSKISEICTKVKDTTWYYLTDCHAFVMYVQSKVKYVDQLKEIIADYLSSQPLRTKRRIIDLGGDILKFLFGTLTQSYARIYNKHISQLEKEQ
jgi:hypothetical protein